MSFYPAELPVPKRLIAPSFIARPLRTRDAALDFEAYMASKDVIHTHSGGIWPTDDFTVEENRILASRHEQDHQERAAFTFILLNPAQTESLGTAYFLPILPFLRHAQADPTLLARTDEQAAMITFWLRGREQESALPSQVVRALHHWLKDQWAFSAYWFRVNSNEGGSLRALESAGLRQRFTVDVPVPPHRYWFYGE
jgi:RimJ/RimL family protein N-acetyltransferase